MASEEDVFLKYQYKLKEKLSSTFQLFYISKINGIPFIRYMFPSAIPATCVGVSISPLEEKTHGRRERQKTRMK